MKQPFLRAESGWIFEAFPAGGHMPS